MNNQDKTIFDNIINNNINAIREYINNGFDLNILDNNNESLLYKACKNNNYDLVKLLLDNNAHTINNGKNVYDIVDNKDIIEYLINNDINLQRFGGIPSTLFIKNINNYDIIKIILDKGYNTNLSYMQYDGKTALWLTNDINIFELLLENGADPNIKNNNGKSILFETDNINKIKLLLEYGADPNIMDYYGNTPLMLSNNIKKTQLLLDFGADVNIKNKDGKNVLEMVNNSFVKNIILEHINKNDKSKNKEPNWIDYVKKYKPKGLTLGQISKLYKQKKY